MDFARLSVRTGGEVVTLPSASAARTRKVWSPGVSPA